MGTSKRRASSTTRVVEDLKEVVSHFQRVAQAEVRPWGEFASGLSVPKFERSHLEPRVLINLYYYRINYVAISSALWGLASIWCPWLVLVVCTTVLSSAYLFLVLRKPVFLHGKLVTKREKGLLLAFSTVVQLALTGTFIALTVVVALSGLTVIGHALLRPKSIRSKFSNFGGIEQLGPQGMFEEEAALKRVEALERGTLSDAGSSNQHGTGADRMSELHSRRRDGARQRDDMLTGAAAQFYQVQQQQQQQPSFDETRARSISLPSTATAAAPQYGGGFVPPAMQLTQQQQAYLPATNSAGGGGPAPQVQSPHANKRA